MLRVYRQRIPNPIQSNLRRHLYGIAEDFFSIGHENRRQRKFDFDPREFPAEKVMDSLMALFHRKCAYCEILLDEKDALLHRHRPPSDTINENREYLPDHYWWLAYQWNNLYLACPKCVRAKGTYFSIDGQRSPIGGRPADLRAEKPLLLDPCSDIPERHFICDFDGRLYARTLRGKYTIERMDLNRETLVMARRARASSIKAHLSRDSDKDLVHYDESEFYGDEAEFAGFMRGLLRQERSRLLRAQLENIKRGRHPFDDVASVRGQMGLGRTPYIKSIHVTNVGPLSGLSIDLTNESGSKGPWLALIGENSVGKSSVLKAIALTLASPKTRSRLKLRPDNLSDSLHGEIRLYRGEAGLAAIRWTDQKKFLSNRFRRNTLILGYGSTRLTSDKAHTKTPMVPWERIGNLFDPYTALNKPERWLLTLSEEKFDYASRALKALLNLPDDARFQRDCSVQTVTLISYGRSARVTRLSDGLQSVLALACDIMSSLLEVWDAPEIGEGIVLLDEIENHLHPKWKMQIVGALRKAFPRMQFIITTHDPLCLKGMEDGEVMVLRRNPKGEVLAVENLPPVSRMRVDQILTSEHFGLSSTLDPKIERLYAEYYALLRRPQRTSEIDTQLDRIKGELAENRLLGTTRRERLMLEAIDRYLSQTPEVSIDASKLNEELQQQLVALLSNPRKANA